MFTHSIFEDDAPLVHRNSIKSNLTGVQYYIKKIGNKPIVNDILGEMLLYPDDSSDEITKKRAFGIFEDMLDQLEGEDTATVDDVDDIGRHLKLNNPA